MPSELIKYNKFIQLYLKHTARTSLSGTDFRMPLLPSLIFLWKKETVGRA